MAEPKFKKNCPQLGSADIDPEICRVCRAVSFETLLQGVEEPRFVLDYSR